MEGRMKTKLTELLGIQYPILQGAMAWTSEHKLVAAVAEAGCAGAIAGGRGTGRGRGIKQLAVGCRAHLAVGGQAVFLLKGRYRRDGSAAVFSVNGPGIIAQGLQPGLHVGYIAAGIAPAQDADKAADAACGAGIL